jgi:hypothetical protein
MRFRDERNKFFSFFIVLTLLVSTLSTKRHALLHKLCNNAAKVWQQCCARAKACILEGWSMHLRVQKHASESVKALIQGCESIDSGV